MEAKGKIEKAKKAEELDKKIKVKKITEADKQMELKVFDQMLENRIKNEIAKRIDKAHNYSFNFANYKSTISDSQIAEWTEALKHIQPNGATTLDEVYKKLSNGKPENILPYLLKLNPINALEADIAREYISNIDNDLILKHKELNVIKEILKSKQKYPTEKLTKLLLPKSNKIHLDDETIYKQVKIRLYGNGVEIRGKQLGSEIKTNSQFVVNAGDFIMSKIDARNGAYGIVSEELEGAVVTSSFPYFEFKGEINPKYLLYVVTHPYFYKKIEDMVSGATGRRSVEATDFLGMEIPFPPIDEQNAFAEQIEKQKAIIEGAEKILLNVGSSLLDNDFKKHPIGKYAKVLGGYSFSSNEVSDIKEDGNIPLIKIGSVLNGKITNDIGFVDGSYRNSKPNFVLQKGDIVFAMTRPIIKSGLKYAIIDEKFNGSMLNQRVGKWQIFNDDLQSDYLAFFMGTDFYLKQLESFCSDEANQPNVSNGEFESIQIPLPSFKVQSEIIAEVNSQRQILEGLRKMKDEAEKKIGKILANVWGVEYLEPVKMEVEDEQEN